MRVAMAFGDAPENCGNFEYGEVEDYTVLIELGDSDHKIIGENFNQDISPIASINTLKVFPNPVKETLTVEMLEVDDWEISLFDNAGKLIIQTNINSNQFNYDVSDISSGVYILKIKNQQQQTISKKVIIQK